MNDIEQQILGVVNEVRSNKRLPTMAAFDGQLRLRENLQFDSLDLAEFTVRVEERFGVDIFEQGLLNRLSEICARIECHANQGD